MRRSRSALSFRLLRAVGALLLLAAFGCKSPGPLLGSSTSNREVLHEIIDRGTLRVGTSGTQPPLSMKNARGELTGMDVELAQALADAMKVELVLVDLVISSLTITPRRNARVAFAGPYLISGSLRLTREEVVDSMERVSELNSADRSWAALRGSTGEALILELFPLATFVAVDDMETVVPRVAAGEVDGLFADVPFVQFQLARNPDAGLAALPSPFTTEPLGVAVPADSPLFANLVQNYLNTLDYTGELMQMKMHWMSAGEWLSEVE